MEERRRNKDLKLAYLLPQLDFVYSVLKLFIRWGGWKAPKCPLGGCMGPITITAH